MMAAEIKGLNEAGKPFKAKINPQSLAIMKLKVKGMDDDRDHRRNRQQHGDAPGRWMVCPPTS